jgi:hypothetical protein
MVPYPPSLSTRREPSNVGNAIVAARSLLDFPARWLPDLPEPISLSLLVAGAPVPVVFAFATIATIATTPHSEDAAVLAATIRYDRDELRALVLGVEADRIWHREFLGFCFEKWRRPTFRLSLTEALAGANPDHEQPAWSLERILYRLQARQARIDGLELVAVSPPLRGLSVAA